MLGVSLFSVIRQYNLLQAAAFGFGSGIGWTLAIVALAGIRQKIKNSPVPGGLGRCGHNFNHYRHYGSSLYRLFWHHSRAVGGVPLAAIVQTVLIITGITGFLALMLTLAKSYLATYGEVTITINDARELVVEGGGTLLSALGGQGFFFLLPVAGKGPAASVNVKLLPAAARCCPRKHRFSLKKNKWTRCGLPARSG